MYQMHEWRAQADVVILTNDSPGAEAPQNIISDIVAGYPEALLVHNVQECAFYAPGFCQDPGRIAWSSLDFYWNAAFKCAPSVGSCRV